VTIPRWILLSAPYSTTFAILVHTGKMRQRIQVGLLLSHAHLKSQKANFDGKPKKGLADSTARERSKERAGSAAEREPLPALTSHMEAQQPTSPPRPLELVR